MRMWFVCLTLLVALPAAAQQTELYDCLGEGSGSCADTAAILAAESCGRRFYVHRGKVSWPSLLNVGPVTISVNTYNILFYTQYPVYIEISPFYPDSCSTRSWSMTVLASRGLQQCGGTWESIGPIDLTKFFIPLGTYYRIVAVSYVGFWPTPPYPSEYMSAGLACIRVTSQPTSPVATLDWGGVKSLYR